MFPCHGVNSIKREIVSVLFAIVLRTVPQLYKHQRKEEQYVLHACDVCCTQGIFLSLTEALPKGFCVEMIIF